MVSSTQKLKNPLDAFVIELAIEFDNAYYENNIPKTIELIKKAEEKLLALDVFSQANVCYSLGTSYGDIATLDETLGTVENLEKQLFYFQKSIKLLPPLELTDPELLPYVNGLQLPLYTNYANALDKCGRKLKALEMYNMALNINPNFTMAMGNVGLTYSHYAYLVPDPVHRDYINHFAYHYLKRAIELGDDIAPGVMEKFKGAVGNYDDDYVKEMLIPPLNIPEYSYFDKELDYRRWALNNKLFLNPLNDLPVAELCFAADVLHLPNMVVKVDAKPALHGLYNQLKQEYIFARYQFYESLEVPMDTHYADKDTYLLQFGDYPLYSIRIEKMKSAFRILYSLLDKTAFFINRYFNLGIPETNINFRSIWWSEKSGKNGYSYDNVLKPTENFFLSSLYWISKEIYEQKEYSTNPLAKEMYELRNSFEHKYVKIYSESFPKRTDGDIDDLAVYLSENRLKSITLDLLKLIREVLINLSLAVHVEEIKKKSIDDKLTVKISYITYEDEWKL